MAPIRRARRREGPQSPVAPPAVEMKHANLCLMVEASIDREDIAEQRRTYSVAVIKGVLVKHLRCMLEFNQSGQVRHRKWTSDGQRGTGGRDDRGLVKAMVHILEAHSEELSRLHAAELAAATAPSLADLGAQLSAVDLQAVSNAAVRTQNRVDMAADQWERAGDARVERLERQYAEETLAAARASAARREHGDDDGDEEAGESDDSGEESGEESGEAGGAAADDAGTAVQSGDEVVEVPAEAGSPPSADTPPAQAATAPPPAEAAAEAAAKATATAVEDVDDKCLGELKERYDENTATLEVLKGELKASEQQVAAAAEARAALPAPDLNPHP